MVNPYVTDAGYVGGYDGGRSWVWNLSGNPVQVGGFQQGIRDANNSKVVLKANSATNGTQSYAWNAGGGITANPYATQTSN